MVLYLYVIERRMAYLFSVVHRKGISIVKKLEKKVLTLLLAFALVLTSTVGFNRNVKAETAGKQLDWEVVETNKNRAAKLRTVERTVSETAEALKGDVRVSIVLEGASTLEKFNQMSTEKIGLDPAAVSYRESLQQAQESMAAKISRDVLEGKDLDVVWNLTLAANIISAYVPANKVADIKALDGVKDVFLETLYEPQQDEISDDPMMSVATEMTTTQGAWAAGYTGMGSRIAIVDTGLDDKHQSFNSFMFDLAVTEYENQTGEEVALLNKKDVSRLWSSLNASTRTSESGANAYLNSKVPFHFNYVDSDFDTSHLNDTQGEHGSHVAGIAAANKYVYTQNSESYPGIALEEVKTQGNAPDAQVLVMKVFGRGGGAYDSDYFVAIEDAIVLGADAVNLSLGSGAPGFTTNTTYQDILDNMQNVNTIWNNSAGNAYNWANSTTYGYLYSDDASFATGGSPATYASTLSTASVDNDGSTGKYMMFGGQPVFYTETSGYGNEPFDTLSGTYEFVLIDNPGNEEADFEEVADVVAGKIAMARRGGSSFYVKANAGAGNGAVATVIGNNQAGTISMNLSGYLYTAPCVSITQADFDMIKAGATENTTDSGLKYYTGSISYTGKIDVLNYDSDYYTMSDFSSWGVPGDLSIKPEITAPGGNIYSLFGDSLDPSGNPQGGNDQYEGMSGTSMASPQMAGIVGVMAQYVRDNDLDAKADQFGVTRRALIQSLLMSTATPLLEDYGDYGDGYYSVMNQGAGLVNVEAAINSTVFLTVDETTVNGEAHKDVSAYSKDGKVKAELGDDPDRSGVYTVEFTMNNLTDVDRYFDLDADFFTQDAFDGFGDGSVYFQDLWTAPLNASVNWYINGELLTDEVTTFDFNDDKDGVYDDKDAQAILDFLAGNRDSIGDAEYADLDEDGTLTSYDAYLALKLANKATTTVPANGSVTVKAEVTLGEDIQAYDYIANGKGAYVEGYLFATEKDSEDGALGVAHSIPVLGYYGSWAEPSMIDKGSYIEYLYELEDRLPYTYSLNQQSSFQSQYFMVNHPYFGVNYAFGGNPVGTDDEYHPERNAVNSKATLVEADFDLIRTAVGTRVAVNDADGNTVKEKVSVSNMTPLYYYVNQAQWISGHKAAAFNGSVGLAEGERGTMSLYVASEYYQDKQTKEINWDPIPAYMEMPFVVDDTAPVVTSLTGEKTVETTTETGDDGSETTVETTVSTITLEAYDNEYIAGTFLYDEEDTELGYVPARADEKTTENDELSYTFEVEDASDHLYVEIWDYAGNVTTVKLNLNAEELVDPEVTISLDTDYVKNIVGTSFRLVATVGPWGIENEKVLWSSSDEAVATVDENGIVTGVEEGTAVITATADADQTKSAACTVEFIKIERELKGFVWDENGEVWMSDFNTAKLPDYNKLSGSLRLPLNATAFDPNGTLYVSTIDTNAETSNLYTMNEETFELTEIGGSSDVFYADMCPAPSLGDNHLLGVYGTYALIINKDTGDYEGAFDLASYMNGTALVGIAYEEQYNHPSYGNTDWVWLVDNAGYIYQTGFLPYNGSYSRFGVSAVGYTGYTTDQVYFQSLYYDGTDLYWSRFNEADNVVNIVFVMDIYNDGTIYSLGKFADGVWPVAGLYNDYEKEAIGALGADHSDAVVDPDSVFETEVVKMDLNAKASKGVLNAAVTGLKVNEAKAALKETADDAETDDSVVTIDVLADAEIHNGFYEVEYDAEKLELVSVDSKLAHVATNSGTDGKVVVVFANLDTLAAEDVVATLTFNRKDFTETIVTVTTKEAEDDFTGSEEELVLPAVEYTVTVSVEGEGGTAEADKDVVVKGESVVVTVTPEEDYDVDVTVNGETAELAEDNTLTLTPEEDVEVVVTFTEKNLVTRVFGENRYETGIKAADFLKKELGIDKFDAVVVATGKDFADALAGSYLANTNEAPILLIDAKRAETVVSYIKENLAEGGTVYVLGGDKAIPDDMMGDLAFERVSGKNRYVTNIEIVKAAGFQGGDMLVATGVDYADALSASAVDMPILLVNNDKGITEDQDEFLKSFGGKLNFYILGGDKAVSPEMEEALGEYGNVADRIKGDNRYETSLKIAEEFFPNADRVVLAYGHVYPDGLCGGPVAFRLGAPVILANPNKYASLTKGYLQDNNIRKGIVLGGTERIDDAMVKEAFQMSEADEIIIFE